MADEILNQFWIPNLPTRDFIETFRSAFFDNNYVLGVQILFEFTDIYDDPFYILKYAIELELNKKASIGNRPVKWYISTDSQYFLKKVKEIFSSKVISLDGIIGHMRVQTPILKQLLIMNS